MITMGKVLALVALTVAAGLGTVQMRRDSTLAAEAVTMTRSEVYAATRVATVFDLLAATSAAPPFIIPMPAKGDLLVSPGCGRLTAAAQDRCPRARSASSTLVESRGATSSTLLRLGAITIAVVND